MPLTEKYIYFPGPSVGGQLVKLVGFPWLIRGMAIAIIIYSPFCYFLRNPPGKEENKASAQLVFHG
jgi:DHA1 family solute carrier family 18 vesicular amine transporter 1/2